MQLLKSNKDYDFKYCCLMLTIKSTYSLIGKTRDCQSRVTGSSPCCELWKR